MRGTVVCRRSTREPTFDAENRRELASRMYDEYAGGSGIFDTVLFGCARLDRRAEPHNPLERIGRATDLRFDTATGWNRYATRPWATFRQLAAGLAGA